MPPHRRYSRSRSPSRDRSHRYKHENDSRRATSSNDRRRHGTRESRSDDRGDKHRRRNTDERDKDSSTHDRRPGDRAGARDEGKVNPAYQALDINTRRDERDYRTLNNFGKEDLPQSSNARRGDAELQIEARFDKDYGRLKSRAPKSSSDHSATSNTEESRKRKAGEQSGSGLTPQLDTSSKKSHFNISRLPEKDSVRHNTVHPESTSRHSLRTLDVQSSELTERNGIISGSASPGVPVADGNKLTAEEEKLRVRQERLALWKKKKAEEAALKKENPLVVDSSHDLLKSVGTHPGKSESRPSATFRVSTMKTSTVSSTESLNRPQAGLNKIEVFSGMSTAGAPRVTSRAALNFAAEEDVDDRVMPRMENMEGMSSHSLRTETAESANAPIPLESMPVEAETVEDEIDPLDAYMLENSSSLTKVNQHSRLAADILNDQESDAEIEQVVEEDILAIAAKKAAMKKKDIASVDHSKQDYEPFRKDFYVEPEELIGLSEAEVDALRLELDGIVIRGKSCPKPVLNWGQCGLSAPTLQQIQRLGYDAPTSIQAQAIPAIMSGRDTIGVAKTGSGKTMAFLLPMFRHIKDQRPLEPMEGPIAMILTPTRELAVQIHKECKIFLKALDLRAICVYGGPPIKDQIADFKRGAEIVVCTPGRMIDILAANQGRVTNLRRVTYTVLDEADRMFDLGFEPQVMKIINNIRPQRQTVLFSATFPKSMEALARKILRGRPVEITVGARSVVASEITQQIEVRPRDPDPTKFHRVLEILGELYNTDEDARTLIFVDRQEAADTLLSQLMRKGYPCNSLHGGKDQSDRDSTISDFKAGIFPILVATSVAARGLDVKQLKLVINYDCPNHMEDYVHRVGRTGRAGNKGLAITFVSEDQERYAYEIAKALRLSQVDLPDALRVLVASFDEKVKAGTEKGTAAGFGGRGLMKFDATRDNEKRLQRKIYGGEDEDEHDKEQSATKEKVDKEEEDETDDKSEHGLSDRVNPEEAQAVAELGTSASTDAPIRVEKVTKQVHTAAAAAAKPNVGTKALDPVAAARARIDAINNRIKTGAKALEQAASNPDAGEYRAMMEINDFPQKARWNVTNRTNIAKVLEASGTSITTQGQYVKPGSSAPAGVPKLYLLIEGPTELCVTDAVKELRRLLAEGTISDAETSNTRYKVV